MRNLVISLAVAFACSARAAAVASADSEACVIDAPGANSAPCSTAPKFALLPDDVVVSFDGKKVDHPENAKAIQARLAAGGIKEVVVLRHGQRKTLTLSK